MIDRWNEYKWDEDVPRAHLLERQKVSFLI